MTAAAAADPVALDADDPFCILVRVAEYDSRSGNGAVIRPDTGERLAFTSFHSLLSATPLTPGEHVHCQLSDAGVVVNLLRMH